MTTFPLPVPLSADTSWLRRSVRLYLALNDPDVDALMAEARLRLVERHLIGHLLHGQPPTGLALANAQQQLRQAQVALFSSKTELAAIMQEWSAQQAVEPLRWPVQRTGSWLHAVE